MNYYELKSQVAKIIPRMVPFIGGKKQQAASQEKGRKSGYQEFKLRENKWVKQERLLNLEEINSFVEVSCRAAACPMPLNLDVWDGLTCPFNCRYCFANSLRVELYSAFYDNYKTMGLRHCDPKKYKKELDEYMKLRGEDPHSINKPIPKAIAMGIPLRLGIRFEDFLKEEEKLGISLQMLQYLSDNNYPVMINTKSDLVGKDKYVDALSSNKGGAAVHMTLISSSEKLLKSIEPGAPTYKARVEAMKILIENGVRAVARIEPFLPFVNDQEEDVKQYMSDMKKIGVKHITFDTYSYSANHLGTRKAIQNIGIDWDRMFLAGCDSQPLGSLLLGKFMELFREEGFSCSTFDMGNVPDNNDDICCEVGGLFKEGFNYGCSVYAARFVQNSDTPVGWGEFRDWVNERGGFLSTTLENDVHQLWSFEGNEAYSHGWAAGMEAVGHDEFGIIWKYNPKIDHRKDLLEGLLS